MSEFSRLATDSSGLQENINPSSGVIPILLRSNETLLVEESPTIVFTNDITGMAIWDNANTTWDGVDTDDEWDSYSDSGKLISRITNPLNQFIERFGFTQLVSGTGTQDTTAKTFSFTAGQTCILRAFYDSSESQSATRATLNVTSTSGVFTYEMSANGGVNWQSVSLNTPTTFTITGSDLRIRITEESTGFPTPFGTWGLNTGVITKVTCNYETGA